jgi:signal transduction histidine kinase
MLLSGRIKSGIQIEKKFGEVTPFEHYPALLNQAIMHIILNAVEAIEEEGVINIVTQEENNSVIIQVSDTGKGMSDELKRRIFDPFFTTKDVGSGSGLGLSITRGIIEKHHGQIEIESNKGKGTTMKLILPRTISN